MAGTYKNYSVGILEAPSDGTPYARKDGDWTQIAGSTPEVFTYDTMAEFPVTGSNNTLYVDKSTSKVYFYNSGYIEVKMTHNASSGIQGGTTNEYYHLTEQQADLVLGINGSISTTLLSDIIVTDNGDGTVTTSSCVALLKASTDLDAEAHGALLAGIGPISLDIGKKYFLVSDWNNGSPIQRIEESTSSTIDNYTISLIGILTRGVGGAIYWTDIGQNQLDAVTKITRRINDESGLIVKTQGGLVSSSTGRYLQITAARYFVSTRVEETPAFNSAGTDRFSQMHGDSTAGFTETNSLAQINNTQYWNTTTHALANIASSRFAIRWIFQLIDSPNEVYSWLGTAQYTTLAAARSALLSTDLPIQLQPILNISVLIAKVIVQQGQANVIEVINIVNPNTQSISTSDHNQLSSLQGGTVDEYYHLTSAQHSLTTSALTLDEGLTLVADSSNIVDSSKIRMNIDGSTVAAFQNTSSGVFQVVMGATSSATARAKYNFYSTTAASSILIGTFGGTGVDHSKVELYSSNGTAGTPTATLTGDILGGIYFEGWDTGRSVGASIVAEASADWATAGDSTDNPTDLVFYTAPDGSGSVAERMRIQSGGNVGIGTSTPSYTLDVNGTGRFSSALTASSFIIPTASYTTTIAGSATANRTITLPNASGTVPLLESNNVFTVAQTFNLSTTVDTALLYKNTNFEIRAGVSNTSQRMTLCGGASTSRSDGAIIGVCGNAFGSSLSGWIYIQAGTASGAKVNITGSLQAPTVYSETAGTANLSIDSSGNITRITSARKYKKSISLLEDASFIHNIQPVRYQSKQGSDENMWYFGIVADQVDDLGIEDAKMLVNYEIKEDGTKQVEGFQYERLTVLLLAELQKLRKEMDDLKQQLEIGG
jgi:hypothetical protein